MKNISLLSILCVLFSVTSFAQKQQKMNIHLKSGEHISYFVEEVDSIQFSEEAVALPPEVGDFYYSDGTWSSGKEGPVESKKCIGIVFHVGQHESDNTDYSTTGIGVDKCNGYVVALSDASSEDLVPWGVNAMLFNFFPLDSDGNPIDNYSDGTDNDWDGYSYTKTIAEKARELYGLTSMSSEGFPATYYVKDYSYVAEAPVRSSGWFLPSISQLMEAVKVLSTYNDLEIITPLRKETYASSSEKSNSPEWYILTADMRGENIRINYNSKASYSYCVRAVLAF